jgi:hypothetical protein
MSPTDGIALIAAERQRQIESSPAASDDALINGQLAESATMLIERVQGYSSFYDNVLPCAIKLAGRHADDPIRLLTIAGAFIAAEIDRLQRAGSVSDQAASPRFSDEDSATLRRLVEKYGADQLLALLPEAPSGN